MCAELDLDALEQIYGPTAERIATHWADGPDTAGCVYSHRECAIMALIAEVKRVRVGSVSSVVGEPTGAPIESAIAEFAAAVHAGAVSEHVDGYDADNVRIERARQSIIDEAERMAREARAVDRLSRNAPPEEP